jgi:hypothetical protein
MDWEGWRQNFRIWAKSTIFIYAGAIETELTPTISVLRMNAQRKEMHMLTQLRNEIKLHLILCFFWTINQNCHLDEARRSLEIPTKARCIQRIRSPCLTESILRVVGSSANLENALSISLANSNCCALRASKYEQDKIIYLTMWICLGGSLRPCKPD